jgi:hypothetical protein
MAAISLPLGQEAPFSLAKTRRAPRGHIFYQTNVLSLYFASPLSEKAYSRLPPSARKGCISIMLLDIIQDERYDLIN